MFRFIFTVTLLFILLDDIYTSESFVLLPKKDDEQQHAENGEFSGRR